MCNISYKFFPLINSMSCTVFHTCRLNQLITRLNQLTYQNCNPPRIKLWKLAVLVKFLTSSEKFPTHLRLNRTSVRLLPQHYRLPNRSHGDRSYKSFQLICCNKKIQCFVDHAWDNTMLRYHKKSGM